jgi:hypothetical protein
MIRNINEALTDVRTTFDHTLHRLQGRIAVLNDDELVLISENAILWFPVDRDGLELWSIRRSRRDQFEGYRLWSFLTYRANKVGNIVRSELPAPTNQRELIITGATWSVRALEEYGQDVLAGDEAWIQEYERTGGKPSPLPPALAAALRQALATEPP